MLQKGAGNLSEVLKSMVQFELTVAELYRTCGQTRGTDREFWSEMERAEMRHAQNIKKMSQIISSKPEAFEVGRSFKSGAIQTVILGIKSNIERIKRKELTEKKMLFIGRDIEHSILESNYGEIVKTNEAEFESLLREIVSDTIEHREYLDIKINQTVS